MNLLHPKNMRRNLVLSALGLAGLVTSGCTLPSKEQWAQVQQKGLIPVLIAANQNDAPGQPAATRPSQQHMLAVQPVRTPVIATAPTAESIPGRPGFVYSPHATPRRVVDVRAFHAGQQVRCPYTSLPFRVPDYPLVASTPAPVSRPVPASPPVTRVPSTAPSTAVPPLDAGLAHLEPVETPPAPAPASPPAPAPAVDPVKPPVKPGALATADAKPAIPYGTRVPGRPGFVYSPHAGKTQLVDVAGTAPGVVVKCPYTNKLFRVPEPVAEEIAPAETFPLPLAAPDTDFANIPLPPAEKKKDNGNAKPAPAPR
ncbi:MAG TPA: hypothetical protein VG796_29820 [Verrucomicrobiales bacterium]|nr:hypothetical protein [Verrucomicrobiales bacterium]